MTKSELRYYVNITGDLYFNRNNMLTRGDTMQNYAIRDNGENWELARKNPVKLGINSSAYFNKLTYKKV